MRKEGFRDARINWGVEFDDREISSTLKNTPVWWNSNVGEERGGFGDSYRVLLDGNSIRSLSIFFLIMSSFVN